MKILLFFTAIGLMLTAGTYTVENFDDSLPGEVANCGQLRAPACKGVYSSSRGYPYSYVHEYNSDGNNTNNVEVNAELDFAGFAATLSLWSVASFALFMVLSKLNSSVVSIEALIVVAVMSGFFYVISLSV